jgi:hypothetical protein
VLLVVGSLVAACPQEPVDEATQGRAHEHGDDHQPSGKILPARVVEATDFAPKPRNTPSMRRASRSYRMCTRAWGPPSSSRNPDMGNPVFCRPPVHRGDIRPEDLEEIRFPLRPLGLQVLQAPEGAVGHRGPGSVQDIQ